MARGLTPPDVAVHREKSRKPRHFFLNTVNGKTFFSAVPADPMARWIDTPRCRCPQGEVQETRKKKNYSLLLYSGRLIHCTWIGWDFPSWPQDSISNPAIRFLFQQGILAAPHWSAVLLCQ